MSRDRYADIASGRARGLGSNDYYGYIEDLFNTVSATLEAHGSPVDGRRVSLHKGLFEDTWPLFEGEHIAFVHIDCDWYDPVHFCLNAIWPRLSTGGVVVVDDYPDFGGCKAATDEFLAERVGKVEAKMKGSLTIRRL
jgi:asparagine synthase (glutamine-hydrolysing)